MTPDGTPPEPLRPAVSRPTPADPLPQRGASLPPFAGGETLPAGPQFDPEERLPDMVPDAERPDPLPLGPSTVEEEGVAVDAAPAESDLADYPDWLEETLGLAPAEPTGMAYAPPAAESAATADSDSGGTDADELPDWLEETLGSVGDDEGDVVAAEPVVTSSPATEDEDFPDWLEQTLATVETHGDVGVAAEPVEEWGEEEADLLDVSELLGDPETPEIPRPPVAVDVAGTADAAAEQVAERLERIARALREGGAGALDDSADPLALLVTGFVLGYEQRERGG